MTVKRILLAPSKGFSLVEMAVVLVILGLVLAGLFGPLSAQMEQRNYAQTQNILDASKESLLGYAMINGRLPCPASAASNGIEDPLGGGVCNHAYDGFLPAATLGLAPTDANGYAVDGWTNSAANRIRYALTTANSQAFSTNINSLTLAPNLRVCASSAGITATTCGSGVPVMASAAVAVLFSLGKNAASGVSNVDEAANADNNLTFVNHELTTDFDDQLTWISYPLLAGRLVSAGKLP
jgi:prepilin-type N-terminal cleavage/methylation domain-containing protein